MANLSRSYRKSALLDQTKENFIIIACVVLYALPFLATRYSEITIERYYLPHYQEIFFFLLFAILLLTIFEIVIMLLVVEGAKHLIAHAKTRAGKIVCRSLLWSFFASALMYHLLIASSWYHYTQTGFFLGRDTLRLLPLLLDFHYVINTIGPGHLRRILGLFAVVVAVTCWIMLFAPRRSFYSFIAYHGRAMIVLIVLVIAVILPQNSIHPVFYGIYRANAFFGLSPQSSLLWAYLRYGSIEPNLPSVSFKLVEHRQSPPPSNDIVGKNVFLFVVEALRSDAIDPKLTPTLHRLAQEGISFENSYSQSSETSESMLSIITGRYPLRSRLRTRSLDESHLLRVYDGAGRAGYLTGLLAEEWSSDSKLTNSSFLNFRFNPIVADFSNIEPADNPFAYSGRGLGNYSVAVADRLKMTMLQSFVKEAANAHKNLFAIFYFMSSHFPYDQSDGVPALRLPNQLRGEYSFLSYPKDLIPVMRNRYQNTIAYVDSLLASFVLFLERRNELSKSIIIITGDHGQNFGEHDRVTHSRHLDQEAVRVPLIFWGAKGHIRRWGPTVPVGHVDIAPTIYHLLGLPTEPSFQGEKLLRRDTETDSDAEPARPLFLSIQALMHEDAIILWPWKLVRNFWGEGWRLFRLDTDPGEWNNLFDPTQHQTRQLCACLVGYRASQLYYYDPVVNLDRKYYPPKYNTCADIIAEPTAVTKICGLR